MGFGIFKENEDESSEPEEEEFEQPIFESPQIILGAFVGSANFVIDSNGQGWWVDCAKRTITLAVATKDEKNPTQS